MKNHKEPSVYQERKCAVCGEVLKFVSTRQFIGEMRLHREKSHADFDGAIRYVIAECGDFEEVAF